ncbi:MAG: phosphoribosylamine--glycine ligase [Candidatus Thermoplasmatota archaeon]|nr:phosphoribosylamine--glycine ligase [Candidatus Thermoplasmatota archaeon]
MNILVVGGGAREHAICHAVARSENATVFCVMNNLNPGIEKLVTDYLLQKETAITEVVSYAKKNNIDIALIGPEAPLEAGLADELIKNGIQTCAPKKNAARIETDKEWMRLLLTHYHIPGQLRHQSFTNPVDAEAFIEQLNAQVAIKPIGLTGGKGVHVAGDHFNGTSQAMSYVKEVIHNKIGGAAKVLIEEKACGEEFTLQAFTDGTHVVALPAVQDHKRLLPDDKGPNTGGMGSYSCANGLLPFLTKQEYQQGVRILQHIVDALAQEHCPYVGPIYGQFILTADGVKIIEVNARFGDPEAMNVLPLLQTDFLEVCSAMLDATLSNKDIWVEKKSTVCKYVVPEGYGVKSMVGEPLYVDEEAIRKTGAILFYASVNKKDTQILTGSSRSLAVVGITDELTDAEEICEKALTYVTGDHLFIRHDIGTKKLLEKRMLHMKEIREQV